MAKAYNTRGNSMRAIIVALLLSVSHVAYADVIDDNVVKAEKSLANAQKRLEKARQCQAERETCLAEMTEKARKSAERAQKKLEALTTASVAE